VVNAVRAAPGAKANDPTTSRSDTVTNAVAEAVLPECTACGVCCFSDRPDYLPVFQVDYDRMDEPARGLVSKAPEGRFMLMRDGHCSALRIEGQPQRTTCAIYPMRPDCCHWLVRGSALCRSYVAERRSE
jgi:uncharacterized protein